MTQAEASAAPVPAVPLFRPDAREGARSPTPSQPLRMKPTIEA